MGAHMGDPGVAKTKGLKLTNRSCHKLSWRAVGVLGIAGPPQIQDRESLIVQHARHELTVARAVTVLRAEATALTVDQVVLVPEVDVAVRIHAERPRFRRWQEASSHAAS